MALSERLCLPLATLSTPLPSSRVFISALRGLQGRSGIPEVPTSGLPSPPTSPPLAALTPFNELALLPKTGERLGHRSPQRRGGAALMIREECERFFCEPMKTTFHGERNLSKNGSCLTSALLPTPPPDDDECGNYGLSSPPQPPKFHVEAWLEVWDYAGGASFRAFVASDDREKSLFVFFDTQGILGRDLKKALMALIELADGTLNCCRIVACADRHMPTKECVELIKSLQWVGFETITLDHWAHDLDVTSNKWFFLGMEV